MKRYQVVLCGTIAKNIDTAIPNVNFVNDATVEVDVILLRYITSQTGT